MPRRIAASLLAMVGLGLAATTLVIVLGAGPGASSSGFVAAAPLGSEPAEVPIAAATPAVGLATPGAPPAPPPPTSAPHAATSAPAASASAAPALAASTSAAPASAVVPSSIPASPAPPSAPASSSASPAPAAGPTQTPPPSLVPAPLTGALVPPNVAAHHVIAVMIDDLGPARPQSGFTQASVVWQAPAEGGIPRYMLLFQDGVPGNVGPVRSARYYFIGWAAEWDAAYVHAGGSPQALRTLRQQGRGQLVYNVDTFIYSNAYFWRVGYRYAPHNLYTDGRHLRILANSVGAASAPAPQTPVWTFREDEPLEERPVGGHIQVAYPYNRIDYAYDRATNTYLRSVSSGQPQKDAATGKRVAPKNVVIMFVHFGPLNDSHPEKQRLEADFVGSGKAYVATNGRTLSARWVKASVTAPTQFFDAKGRPIALTIGQTYVQVLRTGSSVTIRDGKVPPKPVPPWPAGHSQRPA